MFCSVALELVECFSCETILLPLLLSFFPLPPPFYHSSVICTSVVVTPLILEGENEFNNYTPIQTRVASCPTAWLLGTPAPTDDKSSMWVSNKACWVIWARRVHSYLSHGRRDEVSVSTVFRGPCTSCPCLHNVWPCRRSI